MTAGDHAWSVLPPPGPDGTPTEGMEAVRRFRGRILFDGGRRPGFDGPDGPRDPDPLDLVSHHVVARRRDDPAGTPQAALRVLALTPDVRVGATDRVGRTAAGAPGSGVAGACDRLLGPGATADLVNRLGLDPAEVWEGSGWAVRPGPARARLAARTLAAGVAVARGLGRVTLVGASGTRYGQLHRVLSAGFRRAEGTRPVPVPALADDLQIVHGTLAELKPEFRALVDEMAGRLASESGVRAGDAHERHSRHVH